MVNNSKNGTLSVLLSGLAMVLLAVLLLLMTRGPAASEVVVYVWLGIFVAATASAFLGIVFGVMGLRKRDKKRAGVGLALGIIYTITVSILLSMFIHFLQSITD